MVNHINVKKHDNGAENLEWTTFADNSRYAYETGLTKHYSIKIVQYTLDSKLVKQWDSIKDTSYLKIEKSKMYYYLNKCKLNGYI